MVDHNNMFIGDGSVATQQAANAYAAEFPIIFANNNRSRLIRYGDAYQIPAHGTKEMPIRGDSHLELRGVARRDSNQSPSSIDEGLCPAPTSRAKDASRQTTNA
ncbi:hypothetical protein FALBO_5600 [Fusarium albosuccineum]|uniref:Uncharacterized protein n=1 Tax=Fusarium albosuccineum TaxID=1237068 RepID=A0A8H4LGD0_9HYPO|nr:hypothetical protein FALBO_5600 [Fusarium albosuccineum]